MHRSCARPPLGGSGCSLPGVPLSLLQVRPLIVLLVLVTGLVVREQRVLVPRWRIQWRRLVREEVRTHPGWRVGHLLADRVAVHRAGRPQSGRAGGIAPGA